MTLSSFYFCQVYDMIEVTMEFAIQISRMNLIALNIENCKSKNIEERILMNVKYNYLIRLFSASRQVIH